MTENSIETQLINKNDFNEELKTLNKDIHLAEKSINKIQILEDRVNNIYDFLSRPELSVYETQTKQIEPKIQSKKYSQENIEQKQIINEYIRKGNTNLLMKFMNEASEESGGAVVIPSLYHKIINEINEKSIVRKLASRESIRSFAPSS
ncbi:MAG: phage major capsid protein [Rickettsiaceae bacterium]